MILCKMLMDRCGEYPLVVGATTSEHERISAGLYLEKESLDSVTIQLFGSRACGQSGDDESQVRVAPMQLLNNMLQGDFTFII